ncbi:WYL domain-containing protein [Gaiella sp.]|jgi:proteasome accessory factor C|uniref:WYL domain-containing protein n=1 Tax=Gaiella sp. TaxID=2663207 RepID=UPI002E2FFAC8|nr:WYL domain-containing protein [Gaiella sp.]HEX5583757.1 WYL domain-containing protein [Gaiella sp.]
MSHDADKLIRQLSLVAFLMAERRPLTARDVKGNVEGYSEMSDEAFARRFYSDRAELTALGIPLTSQRDEFTGEELYSLRSEHYFLDQLDLDEDELAALQTALYALEGKFAYAEPLRLALQNLALGRPGFRHAPTATAERVRVTAPDYSPELAARLSKLESAISKQRTIQFRYWSPTRERETERRLNPYALRLDEGVWYVVGHDLDRDATRTFRVARIRSDIRFATRRERDFRQPADFDVDRHRVQRPWQIGEPVGVARIGVQGDTAWWVHRTLSDAGTVNDGVFETGYAQLGPLVSWILRQNGRAIPLEPPELRADVAEALQLLRTRHGGAAPDTAKERRAERRPVSERQPAGPVAPERFGVLQALLAHLLAACGDERRTELDADELAERFSIPREELQETLSLLNLVNFGGGCYTVYAEVNDDTSRVRVDKELYGDVFRKAPKLTPLEARAIRLAIEYVGPAIAADAHTPLARVRRKLEETFGQFELAPAAAVRPGDDEEALVRTLSEAAEKRRVVELEYLKEGEEEPATRLVEPYTIERELPFWRVHTWDRTVDGPRTYRLDRMRSARLTGERFDPRLGFDPNYLSEPATARLWHSPTIARWKLERGARALTDKAAVSEVTFKTEEWLLSEVLADRGETLVLEPAPMRRAVAARARALQAELGLATRTRRKRTAETA